MDELGIANYTTVDESLVRLATAANGGHPYDEVNTTTTFSPFVENLREILTTAVTPKNSKVRIIHIRSYESNSIYITQKHSFLIDNTK